MMDLDQIKAAAALGAIPDDEALPAVRTVLARLAEANARNYELVAAFHDLGTRVEDLERLLVERAEQHLAEIERTQERCNQETAVHRHEAQAAVQQAGELRGEVRDLRSRVEQLEAEAAAAGKQAARLAADAARAERERDGYRQIAHGWQGVALARDDRADRIPQRAGGRP